jgi:hypothetical protein
MIHSAADKLAAVQRELALRRRVYVQRVASHRMTQHLANYQISVFEDIERDYQALAQKEQLL